MEYRKLWPRIVMGTFALTLPLYAIGCSLSKEKRPVLKAPSPKYGCLKGLEYKDRLKELYQGIDMTDLSSSEREWLETVNREQFVKSLRGQLDPDEIEMLSDVCGFRYLSSKDYIFLRRVGPRLVINQKTITLLNKIHQLAH